MTKRLVYVGDPMCSWCWGFSPVKKALQDQCEGRAELSFIAGGLRPFTKEAADDERKAFLRQHWRDVNERTGQPFSYTILERDDFVYDTEPACRAAVTVREMAGDAKALDFFSELQRAFYADNEDVTQPDVLIRLARDFGVDGDDFEQKLVSDEMRQATLTDFQTAHALGVSGFPTVIVREDDDYGYLTVGYQPVGQLGRLLEAWLEGGFERVAAK